jgi:hypothetical protein
VYRYGDKALLQYYADKTGRERNVLFDDYFLDASPLFVWDSSKRIIGHTS